MQKIAFVILLLGLQIEIACGMFQSMNYQPSEKDSLTAFPIKQNGTYLSSK
jgi:hypothetical protein